MVTYDLDTVVGKMRLRLGDNIESNGVLPGGLNFSDEELDFIYTDALSDFGYALYKTARIAAARWISSPKAFTADGLRINRGDPVQKWNLAAQAFNDEFLIEQKYGANTMFTFNFIREDSFGF